MSSSPRIQTFAEFWPYYLGEHRHPTCRLLHFIGSTLALGQLVAAVVLGQPQLGLTALLTGYAFAWVGHFLIEKNRPATFKYPLWSFIGDWKMWALTLTGRLGPELDRAGVTTR
jgi:hypothetical protein